MALLKSQFLGYVGVWILILGVAAAVPRNADAGSSAETEAVEEILQILADRGILSEAEYSRLATKGQTAKSERGTRDVAARLLDGFEWSGDLRLRYEAFYYDKDSTGTDRDNRYRFRYRARLAFKKKMNDWLTVGMRFASGEDNHRSANRTLGVEEDFDPDPLFIDWAYAEMKLPEISGLESRIRAGKIANPFIWKHGKDFIVWDNDISLEGGALMASRPLSENTDLFFNVGGFIDDENETTADPKVFGLQIGGTTKLSDAVETGLRFSWYEWRSLDSAFVGRANAEGNLDSAYDGKARIGDVTAFAKFACSDAWPLEVYGTYIRNFTADSAVLGGFPEDEEDTAWGAGFEIGSSSKWVKFGAGYFYVEANSVVAQFTDSDLFDGLTNRRGWAVYGSRRLAPGVELKVEFLDSDSIDNGVAYLISDSNGDRKRLRTDLKFKF